MDLIDIFLIKYIIYNFRETNCSPHIIIIYWWWLFNFYLKTFLKNKYSLQQIFIEYILYHEHLVVMTVHSGKEEGLVLHRITLPGSLHLQISVFFGKGTVVVKQAGHRLKLLYWLNVLILAKPSEVVSLIDYLKALSFIFLFGKPVVIDMLG